MRLTFFVSRFVAGLMLLLGLCLVAPDSDAAPVLRVGLDKTRIYRLTEPAGGIVVGNPDIVTVSLHDVRTILLTGKKIGDTELIVLDHSGVILRHLDLAVLRQNRDELTIIRRNQQNRFHCSEKCEALPR